MWKRIVSFVLGEGPKGTPPERVRWLIVALCTDDTGYMTGVTVDVNGASYAA